MTRQAAYTLALSAVIITLAALIFSRIPQSTWQDLQPATCFQSGCFCEAVQEPVRQPANTWSSFGFVIAGIWIVFGAATLRVAPYTRLHAVAMGMTAIIVGVGSAFYHATLTFTGQFFDILGMYLLTVLMLVYALERLLHWSNTRAIVIYVSLNVVLSALQIVIPDTRRYIFAVLLLVALAVELIYRRRFKPVIQVHWLHIGLGLFALAFGVWIIDNLGIICSPASLIQGHAIWHILGAVAVICLNRYYMSEQLHADVTRV